MNNNFVYHGSHESFDVAIPRRQIRMDESGKEKFNQISFHATPYKWIALAYTCKHKTFLFEEKPLHYFIGVDLYDHKLEVTIFGFESLEKSLEQLYGDGGYLFTFDKEKFHHTEGLGNLEIISNEPVTPMKIEKIEDPVLEMKKEGVKFSFVDLARPENAQDRW